FFLSVTTTTTIYTLSLHDALPILKNGDVQGLVVQNPVLMGYLGVMTMVKHLQGEKVEKRIDTGVVLATPENMEQPEIKELLYPRSEEHTSELQSLAYLVCRLLLEK